MERAKGGAARGRDLHEVESRCGAEGARYKAWRRSRKGVAVGQRVLGARSREKQKVTGGGPRRAGPLYS